MSEEEFWWKTTIVHLLALVNRRNKKTEYEAALQKREDYRAGLIASVVYNTKLSKKNKNKSKEPLDWFGEKKSAAGNTTVEQQKMAAMNWAKALGGEVKL